MAQLQQFDLGRVLSQAEAIRGQREQNRLAELLAPYREREAMRSEQQAQTQVTDEAIQRTARLTGVFLDTIGDIEQMPPEQQQRAWSGAMNRIQSLGADVRGLPMEYSPENLRWARSLGERLGVGTKAQSVQSTYINDRGERVAIMRDGSERVLGMAAQDYRYDPETGLAFGTRSAELIVPGGAGQETPEQRRQRVERQRLESERARAAATSGAAETAKGQAQSLQAFKTEGLAAADALPVAYRAMELLDSVQTGGWTREAALRASQITGSESADEGELSANLGKAVLSQLRSTFGAAFTEREGERLNQIEAGFGKSTATNKRLLNQLIQISESVAQRGIRAARQAGDDFTASEIEAALNRRIVQPGTGPTNPPPPNPAGQPTPMNQPARPGEVRDVRSETLRKYGIQ